MVYLRRVVLGAIAFNKSPNYRFDGRMAVSRLHQLLKFRFLKKSKYKRLIQFKI